jgi:hypothetical protein
MSHFELTFSRVRPHPLHDACGSGLLEVIQARPPLVRARTVCPETHVHHLGPSLGLFIVNTFFMTGKIINGAKSVLPRAIWDVAFEELPVASLVFPMAVNSLPSQCSNHN